MTDYEVQRLITSWLQVGAVVVAAIALLFSLAKARLERRSTLASLAHEGLVKFVEICANNPELHLMEPEKRPEKGLSPQSMEVERSAYVLLLLTYERAFRYAGSTGQSTKLQRMEELIAGYSGFSSFGEACDLVKSISGQEFADQLDRLATRQKLIKNGART